MPSNELRNAAIAYAEAGIKVLPLHWITSKGKCSCGTNCGNSAGKHPYFKNGVTDASSDPDLIAEIWIENPKCNIGISPSRIPGTEFEWFVIDLDVGERVRNGKTVKLDGIRDFEELEDAYGAAASNVIQDSGSGGVHMLFRRPRGERMPANLSKAIDVIGPGKYIVAAPSNHASGIDYQWRNRGKGGRTVYERFYDLIRDMNIAPKWLRAFDKHAHEGHDARDTVDDDDTGADLRRMARDRKTDLDFDEFAEAVMAVPNDDVAYDDYLNMLFAIHAETEGSAEGRELAETWSRQSQKFDGADFDHRWDSIRDDSNREKKTGRYVLMLAKENGWIAPERGEAKQAVRELNKTMAVVMHNGKGLVLVEGHDQGGRPVFNFVKPADIGVWFANKVVEMPAPTEKDPGATKLVPKDKIWFKSTRRREYDRVVFAPGDTDKRHFNLWRGFPIKPTKHADPTVYCDKFLTHVRDICCRGNVGHYRWVMAWLAHMFQKPDVKPGTSLVLRGEMGTGKSIVGDVIGLLMPDHTMVVDKAEQITGKFNSYLSSTILLRAEEAVWAGDKSAEGTLRNLITGGLIAIEPKGVDAYQIRNYTRLLVTTNHEWAVPAGLEERRFAVLTVSNAKRENKRYFEAIFKQLEAGGYEALMQYLLEVDLTAVDVSVIPKTSALAEQKIASASPVLRWWVDRVFEASGWDENNPHHVLKVPTDDLYNSFVAYAAKHKIFRIPIQLEFGREIKKVAGARRIRSRSGNELAWVYDLGTLQDARNAIEETMGQPIKWD